MKWLLSLSLILSSVAPGSLLGGTAVSQNRETAEQFQGILENYHAQGNWFYVDGGDPKLLSEQNSVALVSFLGENGRRGKFLSPALLERVKLFEGSEAPSMHDKVFESEVPDQALGVLISDNSTKKTKPSLSSQYNDKIDSFFTSFFEAIPEASVSREVFDKTTGQKGDLLSFSENSSPEKKIQNDKETQTPTEAIVFNEEGKSATSELTTSEEFSKLLASKKDNDLFRIEFYEILEKTAQEMEGDRSGSTPQDVQSENSEAPKEKFRLSNWLSKKWASFKNALKPQKNKTLGSVEKGWTYEGFSKLRETSL